MMVAMTAIGLVFRPLTAPTCLALAGSRCRSAASIAKHPGFPPRRSLSAMRTSSSSSSSSSSNAPLPADDQSESDDDSAEWVADFWSEVLRDPSDSISNGGGGPVERIDSSGRPRRRRRRSSGSGGGDGDIVHFNNAGASPSPPPVLRAVASHLALEADVGGYLAEERARSRVESARDAAGRLINARRPREEIALVESATVGWTRAFYSLAEAAARSARAEAEAEAAGTAVGTSAGDDDGGRHDDVPPLERYILTSEAEYAANVVAAVKFARDQNEMGGGGAAATRWRVLAIPSKTAEKEKEEEDGTTAVSTGVVDLDAIEEMLSGRWPLLDDDDEEEDGPGPARYLNPECIAVVCVTHVPTNSGIINPVEEIGRSIAEFNAKFERRSPSSSSSSSSRRQCLPRIMYVVDACQSAGHIRLDVQAMSCHVLTATGRKYLRGPRGTGFLYVKREVANMLSPSHVDHSAAPVANVPRLSANSPTAGGGTLPRSFDLCGSMDRGGIDYSFKPGARRFEFWESSISGQLGLGAAVVHALDTVGMDFIERRCSLLGSELKECLRGTDGVRIHHDDNRNDDDDTERQCGIVTFSVDGMESAAVKNLMLSPLPSHFGEIGARRFELSVVPATSTPVDTMRSPVPNLVRASLTYFNTSDEIASFCGKLNALIENRVDLLAME